jgi:hypothetical protein
MDQRISFITLAVPDVAAVRAFYVDGLGWEEAFHDGDVLMLMAGPRLVLSLWQEQSFEAEVGAVRRGPGVPPVTLAHNVPTREEVVEVLATARAAGAETDEPAERAWGGFTGYFTDPAGFRWEVAWNPGEIGQAVLP